MQIHHRFLLAGVMGWPIAHSRSPKIHNHWIANTALKAPMSLCPSNRASSRKPCALCRHWVSRAVI